MGIKLGSAYGKIQIDTQGMRQDLDAAGGTLKKFGQTVKGAMKTGAMAIGAGLAAAGTAAVGLGKKAEAAFDETRTALNEIRAAYGETAGDWIRWSDEMQEATTYSDEAFQDAASGMRTLVQSYGMGEDQVRTLIESSADLAALKGVDLAGASERLQAAMRGEAESAEFLGLTLNDSYMASIAFNGELADTWETMTDVEKAQYRYEEALNQMSYAQGQASKKTQTFRGAMAQIGEVMQDAWAQVGERMAPALDDLGVQLAADLPAVIGVAADWLGEVLPKALQMGVEGIRWLIDTGRHLANWVTGEAIPQLQGWADVFTEDVLPQVRRFVSAGLEPLRAVGRRLWNWITKSAVPQLMEWRQQFVEIIPDVRALVTRGLDWLVERGKAAWAWITETAIPKLREWGEVFRTSVLPRARELVTQGLDWLVERGKAAWAWITETAIPKLREWGEVFRTSVLPRARELVTQGLDWLVERGKAAWSWITETAIPKLREWGEVFRTSVLPRARELVTQGLDWLVERGKAAWSWITETAIPKLREWGETFRTSVLPRARELVTQGLDWLVERGKAAWSWITETAIPKLREWGEVFKTDVLPKAREFAHNGLAFVKERGQETWAWISETAIPVLREKLTGAFQAAKQAGSEFTTGFKAETDGQLRPALEGGWAMLSDALSELKQAFHDLKQALGLTGEKSQSLNADFQVAGEIIGSVLVTAIKILAIQLRNTVRLVTGFVDTMARGIESAKLLGATLKLAFEDAAELLEKLKQKFSNFADGLKGAVLPDWLTPGSPTPFELGLRGIADAIGGLPAMPDLGAALARPTLPPGGGGGGGTPPPQQTINDNSQRQSVTMYGAQFVGVQDSGGLLQELQGLAG